MPHENAPVLLRPLKAVVDLHWGPSMPDRRLVCTGCDWMQIERSMNAAKDAAKLHVEMTGHTVQLHRQQFKLIHPEASNDA